MKNLPLLLLGAGTAFYFYMRSKKDLVQQLQVYLEDIKLNWAKSRSGFFTALFFDVRIRLENPTNAALKITHIYVEILANGTPIGGVTKGDDFTISVNTSTTLSLEARIQTLNLSSELINLIKGGELPTLSARGYIDTTIGRMPFTKNL